MKETAIYLRWNYGQIFFKVRVQDVGQNSSTENCVDFHWETCKIYNLFNDILYDIKCPFERINYSKKSIMKAPVHLKQKFFQLLIE